MLFKRFAVVGESVKHSLSPWLHARFAKNLGIALQYKKYSVPSAAQHFESRVRDFFYSGGAGLNITSPFKQRAFTLAQQCTPRAALGQAVNTLIPLSATELLGDNTDGIGLVRDLKERHQQSIAGARILILGNGGATQGIIPALRAEQPKKIHVASRTIGSDTLSYAELTVPFDLIINATSLSLHNALPPITFKILHNYSFCYDLVYSLQRKTQFTRWAQQHGVAAADGLGMLIYQAAEAFYQWHRVFPLKCTACVENLIQLLPLSLGS